MSPVRIAPELLRSKPLPWPDATTDKNSRGTVLVAGGSATSPGAVNLSGMAALRAGAGKVLLAVPQSLSASIAIGFPEAGIHSFAATLDCNPIAGTAAEQIAALLADVDVGLIGPGLSQESTAQELAKRVLESRTGPGFVIDAMSLTGLWNEHKLVALHRDKLVITPHSGEMARLMGTTKEKVDSDPQRIAQEAATHLDCIVVLKGATTVVAQPRGALYLHESAIVGLATSGSGDVLAGVLAGLMARGTDPVIAACWSVYLHAEAGRRLSERIGPLGFLARELAAEIPGVMASLMPSHTQPE